MNEGVRVKVFHDSYGGEVLLVFKMFCLAGVRGNACPDLLVRIVLAAAIRLLYESGILRRAFPEQSSLLLPRER